MNSPDSQVVRRPSCWGFEEPKLGSSLTPVIIFMLMVVNQTLGSVNYVLLRVEFGHLLVTAVLTKVLVF